MPEEKYAAVVTEPVAAPQHGEAAFFDVDADFLVGSDGAEVPPRVSAQLDLVRSMRAAKVKSYAARTLGDISPKALQAISRFLDEEMAHTIEQ